MTIRPREWSHLTIIIIIIIRGVTCDQNMDFEVIKVAYTAEHLMLAVTTVEIRTGGSTHKHLVKINNTLVYGYLRTNWLET
jgi:hypothetical protein